MPLHSFQSLHPNTGKYINYVTSVTYVPKLIDSIIIIDLTQIKFIALKKKYFTEIHHAPKSLLLFNETKKNKKSLYWPTKVTHFFGLSRLLSTTITIFPRVKIMNNINILIRNNNENRSDVKYSSLLQ